jgi:hypothetical protein
MKFKSLLPLLPILLLLAGCVTPPNEFNDTQAAARTAMEAAIKNEPPGDYFIGRRYFKVDYKFWGYIRQPGQPWSTAKLVMLNENTKLAPDRQKGILGSDNGYEYKLYGNYSGDTVYEPASNSFYPEFVLTGYELISTTPGPIFSYPGWDDPTRRIIESPH